MTTDSIPVLPTVYVNWTVDGESWSSVPEDQFWIWGAPVNWVLNITEPFSVKDKHSNEPAKEFSEKFSVKHSKYVNDINSVHNESLTVADAMAEASSFLRTFAETIKVKDAVSKDVEKPLEESLYVGDSFVYPVSGVLSDFCFQTGTWTLEEIRKYMVNGKHVGYETFKNFIDGDYTYDKALFKTSIHALTSDRGVINDYHITVDVPDIVDRGSATVSDQNTGITIPFNRTFHIAPEVTCTMKTGTSSVAIVPHITSVTETQFTVYLVLASTGEKTKGTFVWNAIGY